MYRAAAGAKPPDQASRLLVAQERRHVEHLVRDLEAARSATRRGGRLGASDGRAGPRRRRRRPPPKPVAITVTRTSSPSASSITAPKMTFAFWSAALVTTSAASFTSKRPMSGPPVMLSRIPVAPSIDASSSGEETAARAASAARFSPRRGADAHQRGAGVAHDRAHVGEVEVDEAGHGDQVGDPLDALAEDVVGHPERVDDRRLLLDHLEQPVVLDHDQRVDAVAQARRSRARPAASACGPRRRTAS